jgi:hypothetical protein
LAEVRQRKLELGEQAFVFAELERGGKRAAAVINAKFPGTFVNGEQLQSIW